MAGRCLRRAPPRLQPRPPFPPRCPRCRQPRAGRGAPLAGSALAGAQTTTSTAGIPSDNFWLADAQGAVWNFGNAGAFGSAASLPLNHPIVGITATKDQQGYWLVASDGGIFTYGDASFYGSTGSIHLNKPIVGHDPHP